MCLGGIFSLLDHVVSVKSEGYIFGRTMQCVPQVITFYIKVSSVLAFTLLS
jgi:hypothetical protein